jgi:hypothetical protein
VPYISLLSSLRAESLHQLRTTHGIRYAAATGLGEVIVKTKSFLQGSGVMTAKLVAPILVKARALEGQPHLYQPKPSLPVAKGVRDAALKISTARFGGDVKSSLQSKCAGVISEHLKGKETAKARNSAIEKEWIKRTAAALEKVCCEAVPKSLKTLMSHLKSGRRALAYNDAPEYVFPRPSVNSDAIECEHCSMLLALVALL